MKTAWLIEGTKINKNDVANYLTVENGYFAWTQDVEKAIRFCRRKDADMIAEIVLEDCSRVAEHEWVSSIKEKEK